MVWRMGTPNCMCIISSKQVIFLLVTEKLLMTIVLFLTGMEALGSLCFSITPSIADLTLALVSVLRGMEAAEFPQENIAVGGNRCKFPAFL